MGWSWIVLTLVLNPADDQLPKPPTPSYLPPRVGFGIGQAIRRTKPSACMAITHGHSGACELLETIDANLCPDGLVDELTIAASRLAVKNADGGEPRRFTKETASSGAPSKPSEKCAAPRKMDGPEAKDVWPMTLREAIRTALSTSEVVRVLSPSPGMPGANGSSLEIRNDGDLGPIVLARRNADASVWRFQAEVMAQVRSVEQQYWNLAQAHVQLWAADRAVSMGKEVLDRERAELVTGRGTVADVAEAQQRVEQLELDLVTRTSDVITTERQLRNLMGLPPADDRRIIPLTHPTEARLEPDWDSSLCEMLAHQPDIVQQRTLVRLAELGLLNARNQLLPILGLDALHDLQALGSKFDRPEIISEVMVARSLGKLATEQEMALAADGGSRKGFLSWQTGYTIPMPLGTGRYPLANSRQAQYILLRSRAYYRQIVHQTTHSLARFVLEIDANHKQYRTASRLRQAAAQRLDAQRAYYEEGRITVDRYLDAISQYATAVATEAQYRTTYNVSIVALEEAKGTLLAYDNIAVAEASHPSRKAAAQPSGFDLAHPGRSKTDQQVMTASLVGDPTDMKASTTKAAGSSDAPEAATPPKTRTWTFSLSIGGTNPLQIKGTVTSSESAPPAH